MLHLFGQRALILLIRLFLLQLIFEAQKEPISFTMILNRQKIFPKSNAP